MNHEERGKIIDKLNNYMHEKMDSMQKNLTKDVGVVSINVSKQLFEFHEEIAKSGIFSKDIDSNINVGIFNLNMLKIFLKVFNLIFVDNDSIPPKYSKLYMKKIIDDIHDCIKILKNDIIHHEVEHIKSWFDKKEESNYDK